MTIAKPKTLRDFPKLAVTAVRQGAMSDDGYQCFEIDGIFDPVLEGNLNQIIEGTGPQWFWLLFGQRGYLSPILKSFDRETGNATLVCHEKKEPKVLGLELAYLSPYWQAFNVWMVLDPDWGWEPRQFQGADAVAEDYEAQDVSLVDGREVRVWTKLEPIGANRGQSRHYPATDQTLPVRAGTQLMPGAWGHEHCGLCNDHIDAGMSGYVDSGERWMCQRCYERYASRHDLVFVDEL